MADPPSSPSPWSNLQCLNILLVDDEPNILRSLRMLLEREANVPREQIMEAVSGEAAMDALRARPFDLVISDQRMGKLSGLELLEWTSVQRPHAGRVLLTGYADLPVALDAINRSRVHTFLQKPWRNDDLLSRLEEFAMRRRSEDMRSRAFARAMNSASEAIRRGSREPGPAAGDAEARAP